MLNRVKIQRRAAEGLRKSAALIRKGWTTGACARKANGSLCGVNSKYAACFCAIGAMERTMRNIDVLGEATRALEKEIRKRWHKRYKNASDIHIANWNDRVVDSGDVVAAVMEKAAKHLEKEAAA